MKKNTHHLLLSVFALLAMGVSLSLPSKADCIELAEEQQVRFATTTDKPLLSTSSHWGNRAPANPLLSIASDNSFWIHRPEGWKNKGDFSGVAERTQLDRFLSEMLQIGRFSSALQSSRGEIERSFKVPDKGTFELSLRLEECHHPSGTWVPRHIQITIHGLSSRVDDSDPERAGLQAIRRETFSLVEDLLKIANPQESRQQN